MLNGYEVQFLIGRMLNLHAFNLQPLTWNVSQIVEFEMVSNPNGNEPINFNGNQIKFNQKH